jgi:glycosyltransferase involved in cell wall biosynthesis
LRRLIVSVTNDLTTDQRVHKICTSLQNMGFEIILIGRLLKNSSPLKRRYKTIRMKLWFTKGFLFYANYNMALFFKLLFIKKEVLLANDLDTLLPNFLICKLFNKPLVYDSHELFTEVPELIDRPFQKNFWLKIEKIILPKIKYCYTVSNSIADYYNDKYNTDFKVVKNYPKQIKKITKSRFPFEIENKKLILYQGALNKGRGLELMIYTMSFIEEALFVLIGDGDIKNELKYLVEQKNLQEKVKLISKMSPAELKNLTPLAHLGVSLEEDLGLNYRYALPNKLFDYIQANIPVLVSDLPEMKRVVLKYNFGEIVTNRNPKALAEQIKTILTKDNYKKTLKVAAKLLTWENEEKKLIKIYKNFV